MLTTKLITNQATWESFLQKSDQVNFLQNWHWGQFQQSLDHQAFRLGFYKVKKLVGIALLIKVKAKRGTYLECPGGPVLNWQDKVLVKSALKEIKQLAKQQKASFVRLRPTILTSVFNPKDFKLIKSPMHLHAQTTWVLDLTQSEEEILGNMRKNTRYAIKQANKLDVKVEISKKLTDIDKLYRLQLETVKRKKFVPFSKLFLRKLFETFKDTNQIQLFKASYQGQILAIAMIHYYGQEAVYHYSGSSSLHRNIPASYAIQWQAIKLAKSLDFRRYNFWGYTDNPKHRFFGPSLFKKGFGGYKLEYIPAQDLPIKSSYWLTYLFETLRRFIRRL